MGQYRLRRQFIDLGCLIKKVSLSTAAGISCGGIEHLEAAHRGKNAVEALPMAPLADARKACFALAPAKVLVSNKASQRAGKSFDTPRRRSEPIHTLLDQIGDAANLAGDNNRELSTHCLIDRQSPRLVLRGQDEDIGCGVEARQF